MELKSKSTAFLLCYFLGALGVHRFYLNRVLTGLLMLLTGGGFGIWWIIDSVLIATDRLTDASKRPLRIGPPIPGQCNAGFWVRVAAFSADYLLIGLGIAILAVAAVLLLPGLVVGDASEGLTPVAGVTFNLLALLLSIGYFTMQTASERQATWGKRAFGLYVTTATGQRVGFGRALWRTLCYALSSMLLGLGYVMAGFGQRKRALHDYLAGTLVLYAEAGEQAVHAAATRPQRAENPPSTNST